MLSIVMLNVIMLSVSNMPFMLSVIMLSVVMLSVVAPKKGRIGFQSGTFGELIRNYIGVDAITTSVKSFIFQVSFWRHELFPN